MRYFARQLTHSLSGCFRAFFLRKMSIKMILLQDSPPLLALHTSLQVDWNLLPGLVPDFSTFSVFSRCNKLECWSLAHSVHLISALQSLAICLSNRHRKHSFAFLIQSILSSSVFGANALHSLNLWSSQSWNRQWFLFSHSVFPFMTILSWDFPLRRNLLFCTSLIAIFEWFLSLACFSIIIAMIWYNG